MREKERRGGEEEEGEEGREAGREGEKENIKRGNYRDYELTNR